MEEILDARGKPRVQTFFEEGSSMTVQSDAHLADIQEIMKQFGVVGMAQMLQTTDAQFMDVSEFTDYADMMNHVRIAEVEFMKLPSKIREKFGHDVMVWLDSAHERRAPEERASRTREGDEEEVTEVPVVDPVVAVTEPSGGV